MIIYFVEKRTTIHCGRLFLSKVNHCISFFFKANTGQNDINGTEMYYIFHFNLNFKFPLFKLLLISEFCESYVQLIAISFAYGTFEQNTFEQSTFVGKNRLCRMISFFHWKWNIQMASEYQLCYLFGHRFCAHSYRLMNIQSRENVFNVST